MTQFYNNIWTEIRDEYGSAPNITKNQLTKIVKNVLTVLGIIKK